MFHFIYLPTTFYLQKLFEVLIDHAVDFKVEEESFVAMQRQLKKSYHNLFIKPERMVRDVRLQILKPTYWTPLDKYANIDDVTPQDLMTFVKDLYSNLFVEMYVAGNVTREVRQVCFLPSASTGGKCLAEAK